MWSALWTALQELWHRLWPWYVLDEEFGGFVRRFGLHHHDLKPGFNWMIPLVDSADYADMREACPMLEVQSLETADGVGCSLRLKMTYRVVDIHAYWRAAQEGTENIQDVAMGELGEAVIGSTWADVKSGKVLATTRTRTRAKARKWGLEVDELRLVDCTRGSSLRLWQTQTQTKGAE